jgi:hypothetical protein
VNKVGNGGFFFEHPICRERMYTCSTKYREEWYGTDQVPVVLSIVTHDYPHVPANALEYVDVQN